MVNFWSSVFSLPKQFYSKVDSLCSAFLWKNCAATSSGARVSWSDVCRSKSEGGFGIRQLEEFEVVFKLKQIWKFFSSSGSLWFAWLKGNIFRKRTFWLTESSNRLSKTVNSWLLLKPTLINFLKFEVGDGDKASFWYDCWTDFGQLITFLGAVGPRLLRLKLDARVCDAAHDGNWSLPAARSNNFQELLISLKNFPAPHHSKGEDSLLWRKATGTFASSFSSKDTWEQICAHSPRVTWAEVIWFKEHVPHYSLISWLAMLQRLSTRDRLRSWGMNVPPPCVLCAAGLESHEHLFFGCDFSSSLWIFFASKLASAPPTILGDFASWNLGPQIRSCRETSTLLKLILQVIVYQIWTERNSQIFNLTYSSLSTLLHVIDRTLRNRLFSFSAPDQLRLLSFSFTSLAHLSLYNYFVLLILFLWWVVF